MAVSNEVKAALTNRKAYMAATPAVRSECLIHIDDAVKQVQGADTAEERRAMLARLPDHIREMVDEWVRELWGVEVVCAVTETNLEARILPRWGQTVLVRKKGP